MRKSGTRRRYQSVCISFLILIGASSTRTQQEQHYLYVAMPGSDDAGQDRSVRLLVFDIDRAHRFVKRIPLWPAGAGDEETVRGVATHTGTRRLFISTTRRLAAVDLSTEKVVWQKSYEDHCCDRFAVSPDGQTIYAPAFGGPKWYVINAATGELRTTVGAPGWARDAIYSRDGGRVYLSAWESDVLSIADTRRNAIVKTVGPFGGFLCPFTLNARGTLAFANVDGLVGFEVGDLQTGLILDSVEAQGYDKDAAAKYECPSHGIGFTPDERELWIADGVQNRVHVFDATVYPPAALASLELPAPPTWISFSIDGRYVYPSTGDVVAARTRKIVATLEDDRGVMARSEQLLEIDFARGVPIRSGERIPPGR